MAINVAKTEALPSPLSDRLRMAGGSLGALVMNYYFLTRGSGLNADIPMAANVLMAASVIPPAIREIGRGNIGLERAIERRQLEDEAIRQRGPVVPLEDWPEPAVPPAHFPRAKSLGRSFLRTIGA